MTPRIILLGNMTGAVLLLAMNAVCWSAAVNMPCEGVCDGIDREVLVQIGSEYFEYAYKNLDIEELSRINDSVCMLFDEYSRLSVTLQNHGENDSLHTDLTLLVLVAEKILTDYCEYAVEGATNSTVNCSSISSISQHCLHSESVRQKKVKAVKSLAEGVRTNLDTHPSCWMTQFYQNSSPEEDVWETLLDNVSMHSVTCSLNQDETVSCGFS